MENKPKVIVIVGPTGSGKTSLALEIATRFQGEIISADSRQVYTRLDIGTEKITHEEMRGVRHHLIDVVDINTVYTATDFKKDASIAIADISSRGHIPIVAGGTFFYIDTLLEKIIPAPVAPNIELRARLESQTPEELFLQLQRKDPTRASGIDIKNKRRLIRALEITDAIVTVPPVIAQTEYSYNVLTLGIITDKIELRKTLRTRAEQALQRGLLEETKQLLAAGISRARLAEIGHEYKIVMRYIDGGLTDAQLIQKFEEKNWQYAKRQLMWLKRDKSIAWFARENCEAIFTRVEEFLT